MRLQRLRKGSKILLYHLFRLNKTHTLRLLLFISGSCLVSSSSAFLLDKCFNLSWNSGKVMEADEACFLYQEMGETEHFFCTGVSTVLLHFQQPDFCPLPATPGSHSQRQRSSSLIAPQPTEPGGHHQPAPVWPQKGYQTGASPPPNRVLHKDFNTGLTLNLARLIQEDEIWQMNY